MLLVPRYIEKSDRESMMRLCRPWGSDGDLGEKHRQEWESLWSTEQLLGVALEDVSVDPPVVRGLMVGVLQTRDQYEMLVSAEEPDALRTVCRGIDSGQRWTANHREIAFGNATDGLGLFVCYVGWEGTEYDVDPAPVLRAALTRAFLEFCGGYRFFALYGEVGTSKLLEVGQRLGCRVLNAFEPWWKQQKPKPARRPYLIGIEREAGLLSGNLWFARAFTYFPPIFGFTDSQQEVLSLAKAGLTDLEIAARLGSTADAVKKRWQGIYDRVRLTLPSLLPTAGRATGARGLEKRRALLRYISERQEELRPYRLHGGGGQTG